MYQTDEITITNDEVKKMSWYQFLNICIFFDMNTLYQIAEVFDNFHYNYSKARNYVQTLDINN